MITVVHVITQLELGGAQENTLHTCRALDRRRFDVALLFGPGGLLDAEARALPNTRVESIPELVRPLAPTTDALAVAALTRRLRSLLHEHRARGSSPGRFVVHTHSSKAGILGRLAARAAGVPRVVHSIHGFGFHEGQAPLAHRFFLEAERVTGRITDAFIGVSRANLAEAQARGIIRPGQRTYLIRSGMDLDAIRSASGQRASTRAALGLEDADEAVLTIANFKPQKDPLTMIAAMQELVAVRPRAKLLFAGDGELRPSVEAAIARAGLSSHVALLGWRRDIPALLAASDVVALSSVFEGLPRSAVQALTARRPFVGTRVDGTAEVIRQGRNGFLVEPRSPAALAQALARALVERPVDPRDELLLAAWEADTMVRAQEALYEELAT
jgi:glycosyltransferase involved in cell wall biosynthesis